MASTIPRAVIVDSEPELVSLLDELDRVRAPARQTDPPSLYLDIEGQNLCRFGTMSILTLNLSQTDTAYLVDVYSLQSLAFTTTNEKGTSLQGILESPSIPKAFFDIRNDSDALFSLFGVRVAGVHDIQLMELARRRGSRRLVSGLARCLATDLTAGDDRAAAAAAAAAKRAGERLWAAYARELAGAGAAGPLWRARVRTATADRIEESRRPSYQPNGAHKSLGPRGW